MSTLERIRNADLKTVEGFGEEWSKFTQSELSSAELDDLFSRYFDIFPWDQLPANAEGFDLGCGSGRWAARVAPRVGILNAVDPSPKALAVSRENLKDQPNVRFHQTTVDAISLRDGSQDFGYSLGVLHHVPDTQSGIDACVRKLKPGAPFLLYLYYSLDNRPLWFRGLWRISNLGRSMISRMPERLKQGVCDLIAVTVYWPLSRLAKLVSMLGLNPASIPLSFYRDTSLYTLRTDALDRFGTRLEQRFSRREIQTMMERVGLTGIRFREAEPYWVALGFKGN